MIDFPYIVADFRHDEWEEIPRTDKLIIRDYYLLKGNLDQIMNWSFYETDRKIRGAMKTYVINKRPKFDFAIA